MQISTQAVLAKIGQLTLEKELLEARIVELEDKPCECGTEE